jgi:hypothetical protein
MALSGVAHETPPGNFGIYQCGAINGNFDWLGRSEWGIRTTDIEAAAIKTHQFG